MPIGLFGRRAKSMVGLDIGTSRVKLVELTARGASVELTRAAVELTPVDAIRDGKVVQPEQVAAVIKKGLALGHFRPGEVVAAIAGQGVVVRHVQFPKMPEEELREALKWEGQKYIPFPMEEAVVDFELIHGVADPEVASMEVMLVAAQRSIVDSHLAAIELAGLRVVAVDVQPFTVLRALRYEPPGAVRPPTAGNGIVAYVDIGAGTTDIVIAEGEILRFTRIVPVGATALPGRSPMGSEWGLKRPSRSRLIKRGSIKTNRSWACWTPAAARLPRRCWVLPARSALRCAGRWITTICSFRGEETMPR